MTVQENISSLSIGMVLFPNLTQLDFTGPYEIFAKLPNTRLHLLAENLEPIRSERGLSFLPDTTFAECPPLDMLFVPGGSGVNSKMEDKNFLNFLKTQGEKASYVTSVCTGSLLLAAANLLQGYRATTHWQYLDLLQMFGVETVQQRIVIDRNRVTGAGVTSGIDFALVIAAEFFGDKIAQEIQLGMEYNPQPPFQSGSLQTAPADIIASVTAATQNRYEIRRQIIQRLLSQN